MARWSKSLSVVCSLASLVAASGATAAELTDVVDALDVENNNPYDFHIEPSFQQRIERGNVSREFGCGEDTTPACDFEQTTQVRELDYRRVINTFDIDFQIGLFRDLEFHVDLPIVLNDQRTLEFASDVNQQNSSIYPDDNRIAADTAASVADTDVLFDTFRFFDVPNDGPRRSGIGDMTFGFAWSPFNDRRNPHVGNLTLVVDYVGPTGRPAKANNNGVGRGVHELQFAINASRYYEKLHLDPYFGLRFAAPFAAGNGLFAQDPNSSTIAPGPRFAFTTGTEIMMYEDQQSGQAYTFDFGLDFGYQFEGRDYTPLFDAFAGSSCNGLTPADAGRTAVPDGNPYAPTAGVDPGDAACAWVLFQPNNAQTLPGQAVNINTPYAHDGILDTEGFATFGGHTGFNLQVNQYLKIRLNMGLEYRTPYLITTADAGRDANNDNEVDLNANSGTDINERNPYYNLVLDASGRRLRIEQALAINWSLGAAFQF